jgi:hypothetical protein
MVTTRPINIIIKTILLTVLSVGVKLKLSKANNSLQLILHIKKTFQNGARHSEENYFQVLV